MSAPSEAILHEGDIVVRAQGPLRRLTLNRPKALNALTFDMVQIMTQWLRAWADDGAVAAVLIDGAGERGLCAGGDLRALYDAAKAKDDAPPARFWASEYRLDVLIAHYRKPVVAIMDGVVMGGGVGISAHAAHRVVTERSSVAMPEAGIGYFPDVGAAFLLARAPGQIGMHLALTGERIGAADAIDSGLADFHVPAARLAELVSSLAGADDGDAVRNRLSQIATRPAAGKLAAARQWIDPCYAADRAEDMFARLQSDGSDGAQAALAALAKMSPTSLKITLRNIRAAVSFRHLEDSFRQDYRISLACIAEHDFIEGIRATIVDKDRNPAWKPAKLEDVTPEIVERHFRPLGERELTFAE